jgi:glycosyltransferase involved in cell wall biosynthesis
VPTLETVRRLVGARAPLVWLYTPMMLALADAFPHAPVVYDKMDELKKFAGADQRIPKREALLLGRAEIVFAGGRSLYRSVQGRTKHLRCYPSGVDVEHFATALRVAPHAVLRPYAGRPIFGYVGVIDERLDLALVDGLAAARPDATIVLVGPVTKIDERTLPRRENIVYLGKRGYDELPALLAGFDVALMPFALNEHTENISPTKTLEYLAAGCPVVSTAVPDVVADHADVVRIGGDLPSFVEEVAAAEHRDLERHVRAEAKLRAATWDGIVAAMQRDLQGAGIVYPALASTR